MTTSHQPLSRTHLKSDASKSRKNECLAMHSESIKFIQQVTEQLHTLDKDAAIDISDKTRSLVHALILLRDISKKKPSNKKLRDFIDRVTKRMTALQRTTIKHELFVFDEDFKVHTARYEPLRSFERPKRLLY